MNEDKNFPANATSDELINKKGEIATKTKIRNSNLELYRIIIMILIVAHHFVVNSGLYEVLKANSGIFSSSTMLLFGAWGKTGINCFVLITGYFMCSSKFSWEKLIKLYLQVIFYAVIIFGIFSITGHETFSIKRFAFTFFPIKSITTGFTSCFLLFYLFIPFLNIFLKSLDKRMHSYLAILLLGIYTLYPSVPGLQLSFNYVEWFITLYILAAYIRFYGTEWKISNAQWRNFTLICFGISCLSILGLEFLYTKGYLKAYDPFFFVADSNKILAVALSISSFMWFKDLKLKYSPFINLIGASTFGVLLIHANSDAMRKWLWKETVDCVGHFGPLLDTILYASISVLIIFVSCSFIEIFRAKFIEPFYFNRIKSKIQSLRKPKLNFQ